MWQEFNNLLDLLKEYFIVLWTEFFTGNIFNPVLLVIIVFCSSSVVIILVRWWSRNVL